MKHAWSGLAMLLALEMPALAPVSPSTSVRTVVAHLTPNAANGSGSDFQLERQRLGTRLNQEGAAPDLYKDPPTSEGVRLARYRSQGHELKVWHVAPAHPLLWSNAGFPVVVFVHDGTSMSEEELTQARTFSEAGFAVLAPTFRGENGNPGAHELLFGELDDLAAAVAYASGLPEVDDQRIAIWGHGLGGMLSALASLVPDLGVRYTGSSAGLRPNSAFEVLPKPFEDNPQERNLRLFGPNIHHMRTPHWACVAEQDPAVDSEAVRLEALARDLNLPLLVQRVAGSRSVGREMCTRQNVSLLVGVLAAQVGGGKRAAETSAR